MPNGTMKLPPGPVEVRLFENVYLGDVAGALPHDTIVSVVGRCTVTDGGPHRFEDVEHAILIPDDAYSDLKERGTLERARKGGARPRPSGVTPLDLARLEETWGERAARFERIAADEQAEGLPNGTARKLGELCRQFEAEVEGLRQRAEADAPELAEAA